MAAASFLTVSDDTPRVKHIFNPMVLHVGESWMHKLQLAIDGCYRSNQIESKESAW